MSSGDKSSNFGKGRIAVAAVDPPRRKMERSESQRSSILIFEVGEFWVVKSMMSLREEVYIRVKEALCECERERTYMAGTQTTARMERASSYRQTGAV